LNKQYSDITDLEEDEEGEEGESDNDIIRQAADDK
jgi:hypothetical protein